MKKISELTPKAKFKVQNDAVNYLSAAELKKYLEITDRFLSEEAKEIINWLIVNNDSYISELSTDDEENALAGFYNAGMPKEANLKELFKLLKTVITSGRALEIPVFQTKQEFEDIVNKRKAADLIILDLDTEKGREAVVKKYMALVHKIAHQHEGKINLPYEDLVSCCLEGLTYAMNNYGKKNKKSKATEEEVAGYTFGQFAAFCMRNQILGNGVNDSHTVRIPPSQQKKERQEKGHNTKNMSISGDKKVSRSGDEGSKTIFDFIGGSNDAEKDVNRKDMDKLFTNIQNILSNEFEEKMMDIWCSYYGVFGHKKLMNKEIAKKYNVANSSITYYCSKINNFIMSNKKVLDLFKEIRDIMNESISMDDDDNELTGKIIKEEKNYFND